MQLLITDIPDAGESSSSQQQQLVRRKGFGGGGGKGGGGGGFGGGGKGGSSSSGGSTGRSSSYPYGSRSSGRQSNGLRSGSGYNTWSYGFYPGIGLGGAYVYAHNHPNQCYAVPFYSPNGTQWAYETCNRGNSEALRSAYSEVCGAEFNSTADRNTIESWPSIGNGHDVYLGVENATVANSTESSFFDCLIANSDAHQGLSNGAIAGIAVGSTLGAILLIVGCCFGVRWYRRRRNWRREDRPPAYGEEDEWAKPHR